MRNNTHLIFMITERCNCKCYFCSRNNIEQHEFEPTLEDITKAFEILHTEYPLSKLILSGGEPTLSRYFFEIVEHTTSLFNKVEIQSNGTFDRKISNNLRSYMKKNLHLQLSLDGTRDIHNDIRGKGVFERAIDNIEYLSDVHEHLTISTTVTPYNKANVIMLAQYLNKLHFRKLRISIVQPINPCQDEIIFYKDWNKFADDLLPLCYYRVDISRIFDFKLMDEFLQSGQEWYGITNCGRGKTHIYIQPNFDVLPCTCLSDSVGNLLKDDFHKIRKGLEESSKIVISDSSVCSTCEYKSICNGGCPGYSTKVFGIPNMGDIRCPKVKQQAIELGLIK